MKLITRDTDYAVKALMYMAKRPKQVVSVKELVDELDIPKAFLRRLLQVLSKNKILKSAKGKGGGFSLDCPARKIGISDIIKIFQGNIDLVNCMFKKEICPDIGRCPLRKRIKRMEKLVRRQLDNITILSLINEA